MKREPKVRDKETDIKKEMEGELKIDEKGEITRNMAGKRKKREI